MSKLLPVLSILFVGCSKHLTEDGANESETEVADSTDLLETETAGTTEDSGDCEPGCMCHPPDWVCQPATSEVNIETLCSAVYGCPIECDGPFCDSVDSGPCGAAHEEFFASASPACIDLLTTAETCYFGLTCAELLVSPCDPAHPCYQQWVAFRDAGCELDTAPPCG